MTGVQATHLPLVDVQDLRVHFPAPHGGTVKAVDGVSLTVNAGQTFGIIGESGSGKSTLGRALVGLTRPTSGYILHQGVDPFGMGRREFALHRRDYVTVFQDPNSALNPRITIGSSIREPFDIAGILPRSAREDRTLELLERVGLNPDYARRYPHELSGGQKQRVNIARALASNPKLIVCDEVVAALDVSIQADILNLFLDLQRSFNLTYVFISHDLGVVAHISDMIGVMYLGKLIECGPAEQIMSNPRHPYTQALLSAEPCVSSKPVRTKKRIILQGEIPSPMNPPQGCRFQTRCWMAQDICSTEPLLREVSLGQQAACHFADSTGMPSATGATYAGQSGVMTAVRVRQASPEANSAWDYIIIGAGASGCVLAERLSESGKNRILVIEMGPSGDGFLTRQFIRMPKGFRKTLHDPALTSAFITEPEGRKQRKFVWVRGKVLGGSSAVNGMIYIRGQPQDYDAWEQAGCNGWGWRDIERCFRLIEDHELGDDGVRGSGGRLPVSIQNRPTALTEAIIAAGGAVGLPRLEDLNRHDPQGIGYSPCNIHNGVRVSAADAFLAPASHRPNIAVVTDTRVERILFDGQRAIGVACRRAGQAVTYKANGEIIVAAGSLDSPRLLQLSGIGSAELLADLGIPVIHDSPAVGANMRDHKPVRMQYRLKQRHLSYNNELSGWRLAKNVAKYLTCRDGILATTYDICALARSREDVARPDFQMIISGYSVVPGKEPVAFEREPGVSVHLFPVRPESLGSINIRSADPMVQPTVKANYLVTENDRRVTVDSVRFVRRLFGQAALKSHVVGEFDPGPQAVSDDDILAACEMSGPSAHATGTCQMGTANRDVVDPTLRVRGVSHLRVVDASIFPTMVSGNTMGPVMAVAWRASEIILADQRAGLA